MFFFEYISNYRSRWYSHFNFIVIIIRNNDCSTAIFDFQTSLKYYIYSRYDLDREIRYRGSDYRNLKVTLRGKTLRTFIVNRELVVGRVAILTR